MSNSPKWRFETCCAQSRDGGSRWAAAALIPAAPQTLRRGARAPQSHSPHGSQACCCLPPPPACGISRTKHSSLRSYIKIRSWSCSNGGDTLPSLLAHTVQQPALSPSRALLGIHILRDVFLMGTTYPKSDKVVKSGENNFQSLPLFIYGANPLKSHTHINSLWKNYHWTINKIFLNY